MAKLYSFILLFATSSIINAQITLTSTANTPEIGDLYSYVSVSNYSFDVSQSGASQTWDFSSATGTQDTFNCISLANSSEPSNFPSANLVTVLASNSGETYLSTSSSEISIEGVYLSGITRGIYTDKQEYLKFPITYNDVFNETFSGTVENISAGQTYDRVGTIEITADGYGDLILPYTTIHDVLRIKVVITSTDTYMGFTLPETITTTRFWFNTLNKNYLATTSEVYNSGSLISSYAYYLSETDLVLGTEKSDFLETLLSVYPNPAKNYTIVKNTSFETIPLNIYDIKGVFIKTVTIQNGENQINLSDFKPGIYLIQYLKNFSLYTQKLVVK